MPVSGGWTGLAARVGARLRPESRFHGHAGKLVDGGRECWLLKPTTFMNVSGRAVQALTQFYKIAPAGHAGRAR